MILTDPNPIQYNGYTFPSNVQTVQFDQEPVQDEAKRMVMYVRYRIGLQFHVNATGGGNIDSDIAAIRSTLSQQGKAFVYSNRGFGSTFTVGPGQAWEDVNYGPRPVGWSVKPKGQNKGTTITWTVELCVPTNCAAQSVFGVAMQAQYRLTTRIDKRGYTTLTINGFVEIPKIAGFERASVSDDFLDAILPDATTYPYMQLVDRSYDHSLDKTRSDYTVVFEELTNAALPEGCVAASASHEVSSSRDSGFVEWSGNVSGTYTVANGRGIETAWNAFKLLIQHRLTIIEANLDTGTFAEAELDEQKPGQKPKVAITGLRLSEPEIYRSDTFAFSAGYMKVSSLKAIFGDTNINAGLFRFPSTGLQAWNDWVNSLGAVNDKRGLLGIKVDPNAEMLIDLCANDSPRPPSVGAEAIFTGDDTLFGDITDLQPDPDTETSWFLYETELEVYENNHYVVSPALSDGSWRDYNTSPGDLDQQGYVPDQKPAEETDEVQYRAPSTLIIYLAGTAMRAWFPIPRPKIVSYNGNSVKEISTQEDGCFWRQKNVGSLGIGMPIYFAEWRFKYVITGRPSTPIRPPVNLSEQV